MSDNIPFEIQVEIIKRLPVRSLIRFRSVSKAWKSLIDSSHFIAHYRPQQQHLLVTYDESFVKSERKYVSIVEDDTFPLQRVPVTVHFFVKMLNNPNITVGSSHGLLCLYGRYLRGCKYHISGRGIAVLWNISIRKAVVVVVPNVEQGVYATVLGFGVCHETTDPKIVKINCLDKNVSIDGESISSIPSQVEVFTLSTGVWRCPYSSNLPRKSIRFSCYSVVVDGFVYWLADDVGPGFSTCNLIMSFDTTSEEFREVNLPDSLARSDEMLLISKLRESLIMLETDDDLVVHGVWMMKEDGVSRSFTKLFTINTGAYAAAYMHEFRNGCEPIYEFFKDYNFSELVVYEPNSQHFVNLDIDGSEASFFSSPYIETLQLLDKPDLTVYNENETFRYRDDLFQELNLFSN